MLSFAHLLICTFFTLTVAQQQCEPGWVSTEKSCYLLSDEKSLYHDGPKHFVAWAKCQDKNGHVASVTSKKENDFLKSWLTAAINDSTEGVWLGGSDYHGINQWAWNSPHEKVVFSDWADNPGTSGRCMSMSPKFGYSWVPEDCEKTKNMKFICEQDRCTQPTECFKGSCYTLLCSTHRAKVTADYMEYNEDGDPVMPDYTVCPKGSIARIESKEENDFIKTFLSKSEDFVRFVWTGGYDEDYEWKWQDTDDMVTGFTDWVQEDDYTFYRFHEEGCIALSRSDDWAWKDLDCEDKYPVLCEEPDLSASG
ncbi:hypothetical protein RRG08_052529 [Elysia crispata]|uniref:C-type lectin domain-containing protein n=1 Tax=Elysia crispata TaxID=231223 RepID=A0AAE0Y736_9GAST|nr:hypothetical protein RRG08_052529 [Elysia crispata]